MSMPSAACVQIYRRFILPLLLCLALSAIAEEPAVLPTRLYGTVTSGEAAVPPGTTVSAWIEDLFLGETSVQSVGGTSVFYIDVPGDTLSTPEIEGGRVGEQIRLVVAGAESTETIPWQRGVFTRFDVTVDPGPDLAVELEDNRELAGAGESLTYSVTVSNLGEDDATGLEVFYALPASSLFVDATDGGTEAAGQVSWPAFSLAAGASVQRSVTVTLASTFPADLSAVVGTAEVRLGSGQGLDPDLNNNIATDSTSLDIAPDLVVTKSADRSQVAPGERLIYTLTVSNTGTQDASDVLLTDPLPADVTFFTASGDGIEAIPGEIHWPAFDLPVGASATRTLEVRFDGGSATDLINNATATPGNGPDASPADNTGSVTTPVDLSADLTIAGVDLSAVVTDPQSLTISGALEISVENLGLGALTTDFEITVFDDLDGDGLLSVADTVLGSAIQGAGLPGGGGDTFSVPVDGTVRFRDVPLLLFVDSALEVAELDEDNNLFSSAANCLAPPVPEAFAPVVELNWPTDDSNLAHPNSDESLSVPLVVQLGDDNGDGVIDGADTPDLVFVTDDRDNPFGIEPVLRAVDGRTGRSHFATLAPVSQFIAFAPSGLAAGDLNGDGQVEIVVAGLVLGGDPPNVLLAYSSTGNLLWTSDGYRTHPSGTQLTNRDQPTLADLDGDGTAEILVGGNVFDHNGRLEWVGAGGQAFQSAGNRSGIDSGSISLAADLDLDGQLEVVTGNTAYRNDGTILWQIAEGDGYPAVGNFDADDFPEIVVVSEGSVRLHEHDGSLVWGPVALPGSGDEAGGPPTVADFDADGAPEIGVAGSTQYTVFETDGTVKWQRTTQDASSNMTGSTVFDLDGDGRHEVIYRDETHLRIYRGTDGTVLYEEPISSETFNELPVIADVDGDGRAEIVVTSDRGLATEPPISAPTRTTGLRVYGDANDNWVGTRGMWNQHAYSIDHVADDGSIPAQPARGWLEHNTFRANAAPAEDVAAAADLTASWLRVDLSTYPTLTLTARVGNGGQSTARQGTPVAFYDGDPTSGGSLLGVATLPEALPPGSFVDLSVETFSPSFGPAEVFVVAGDDGAGGGAGRECDLVNNRHQLTYDTSDVGLWLRLDDGEDAVQAGGTLSYTLTLSNASPFPRTGIDLVATLPPYTSWVDTGDGATLNGATVTWPAFGLDALATVTRTLTLTVDGDIPLGVTSLLTTVTASSVEPDATPANNTATDQNSVLTVRADAGGPYTGAEGEAITFDASASSDRDGTVVAWVWDFDGDGLFNDGTGATAHYAFPDEGNYTIAVEVRDDSGETDTASAEVTVTNAAPALTVDGDKSATEGLSVSLTATIFTDSGSGDTHTASIDWGDGTLEAGVIDPVAGTVLGSHTYADDGSFTAQVCVSDDDGDTTCGTFGVSVANADPNMVFQPNVDLRTWTAEDTQSADRATYWFVNSDGTEVSQYVNGRPSFFYGDVLALGTTFQTQVRVTTRADDDYIGFALGFRPGDTTNLDADYLLIDWKADTQSTDASSVDPCFGIVTAEEGLAVSRVRGVPLSFFGHDPAPCNGYDLGGIEELARGNQLGETGWVPNVFYTFKFSLTTTRLRVWVNGSLEFDLPGDFRYGGGLYAFYTYSQELAKFSALSAQGPDVPEGEVAEVLAPFSDLGLEDTHDATIDWGDGSVLPGLVTWDSGAGTVEGAHVYGDNGDFLVTLCVRDDDGGEVCGQVPATVTNVEPTVEAGPDVVALNDTPYRLQTTYTDPGAADTHTATIDWGDGTVESLAVDAGVVEPEHVYAASGDYAVEVCVEDDDGGRGCDSLMVSWVAPVLDVAITKTVDPRVVRPGETLTYTLRVSNEGTLVPQNLVVSDQLPSGLQFLSADSGGVHTGGTITWTLPELGYRSSVVFQVTAEVEEGLTFEEPLLNQATVTDDGRFGADAAPANNTATALVRMWDDVTPRLLLPATLAAEEGNVFDLSIDFEDTSATETHSATLDWGDGSATEVPTLSESGGLGTITASHTFIEDGTYEAQLCITDSSGNTGCETTAIEVANTAPMVDDDGDIDLNLWENEFYDFNNTDPPPNWVVAADGQSVLQTQNSTPGFFYGEFSAWYTRLEGIARVNDGWDDDYFGFALGFEPGDTANEMAEYLVIHWKRADQGSQLRGLRVIRIFGIPNAPLELSMGVNDPANGLDQGAEVLALGNTLGNVGWNYDTDYRFTFEYSPERLRVFVNGTLEADVLGDFPDGRFTFYNHSQNDVRYSGFLNSSFVGDEGQPVSVLGRFLDLGIEDTHTAQIFWGDGSSSDGTIIPGAATGEHTYLDDGTWTATLCVTDDEDDTGCGEFPVEVRNLPPIVNAGPDAQAAINSPFNLGTITFTDPGVLDTHTATIDWGDGTVEPVTATGVNGSGTVTANHTWSALGTFPVTVCVQDDDGGEGCDQLLVEVLEFLGEPELFASKTATLADDVDGDTVPSPGDLLRYTITVENRGTREATGVTFTDPIPAHTELVAASVATTFGTVESTAPIGVNLGEMVEGASAVITFEVRILNPIPSGVTEVVNQGTVLSNELPAVLTDDPNVGGAADPTRTPITAAPELEVLKLAGLAVDVDEDGLAAPGDEVFYLISLTNTGNTAATQVVLRDSIPEHTMLVPGTVTTSQGLVVSEEPELEIDLSELATDTTVEVTFQVRIDDPFAPGVEEIANQARVASAELGEVLSDDPDTAEPTDPTKTPVVRGATTVCRPLDFAEGWQTTWIGDADQGGATLVGTALDVTGDGTTLFRGPDNGVFVHRTAGGEFRFEVDLESLPVDAGGNSRKAGIMVRGGLDALAPRVMVNYLPNFPSTGTPALQYEYRDENGVTRNFGLDVLDVPLPLRLAIEKRGDVYTALYSLDGGDTWQLPGGAQNGKIQVQMGESVEVGMAVASYDADVTLTARFVGAELCGPNPAPPVDPPPTVPCDPALPLDVVYLLDLSGSMTHNLNGSSTRLAGAQEALAALSDRLAQRGDGSRAALVTFSGFRTVEENLADGAVIQSDFTADFTALDAMVQGLSTGSITPDTPTPTALGLRGTLELLLASSDAGHQPAVVFLTDGIANIDGAGHGPDEYQLLEVQAVPLKTSAGLFLSWPEVAWQGNFNLGLSTFDGETLANAMYEIEQLKLSLPELLIYGVAFPGDGTGLGTFHDDLVEYAAWFSGGRAFQTADLDSLLSAVDLLVRDLECGGVGSAEIGGRVWEDLDGDGLEGAEEPGLSDVTVELLDDLGFGVASTVTDTAGDYRFTSLPAGDYTVRLVAGSLPEGVSLPTFDFDGVASEGEALVSVLEGELQLVVDFGYQRESTDPPGLSCIADPFDDGVLDGWTFALLGDADQGDAQEVDSSLWLTGDGTSLYRGPDNGALLYRELSGNFRVEIDITGFPVDEGGVVRKAGLMVRAGLDPQAPRVMVNYVPHFPDPATTALQWEFRDETGTATNFGTNTYGLPLPVRLAIEREGDVLRASYSLDGGLTWRQPGGALQGVVNVVMGDSVLAGVDVASYAAATTLTASFDDFLVCVPTEEAP